MGKIMIGAGMAACLAAGWFGGSLAPVPSPVLAAIDTGGVQRVRAGLAGLDLQNTTRDLFTAEQWRQLTRKAVDEQAAEGRVIPVERVEPDVVAEAAKTSAEGAGAAVPSDGSFPSGGLCPGMRVANAPSAATLAEVRAEQAKALAEINGVKLSLLPAPGACVSSGFGPRGGRMHKGVDYHARTGVPVYAAAAGTVREMKWRDDFGNMVLIDHGRGVFTRYAHLAGFDPALRPGAPVKAGARLGLMGNTASYSIPVHLHYEVLTGNYDTPKASFGLTAVDPFSRARR